MTRGRRYWVCGACHFGDEGRPRNEQRSEAQHQTIASQRVRRGGREEGREEGFVEARNAILALAARVVPEAMPVLQSIHDLDELQRAADQAIARKLGS
jgi:hypothetical protein